VSVEVRLYAAARAAAGGTATCVVAAATLRDLQAELAEQFGPRMAQVLAMCSFLLDGVAVTREQNVSLEGVTVVDVLPPFAGG
jgi:molybdopterin converting factor small subunit